MNSTLFSLTGYRLAREPAPDAGKAGAGATDTARLRRRLGRLRAQRDKARRRLRGRQMREERLIHRSHDAESIAIVTRARERTMTDATRLFGLVEAVRYLETWDIPGAIVECGVWRGGSMQAAAWTLLSGGSDRRALHLFDTFEGMPPPTDRDRRDGTSAADMLASADRESRVWAVADLADVRQGMQETGYPVDRVHYHVGLVEDTVPEQAPEQIALLRLDTDWYASTKHELTHLYRRLAPGGVLIIDDFGAWNGARAATEEFLSTLDEPLLLVPLSTGKIGVRPRGAAGSGGAAGQ